MVGDGVGPAVDGLGVGDRDGALVDGDGVCAAVGFSVTASLLTELIGQLASPLVTHDSWSISNACRSCIVRSRKRTVTRIVWMPKPAETQSSLLFWRRER